MNENEFYNELDKKTEKKSFCTCQTLAIFFFVLLVLVIGTLIFIGKALKESNMGLKNLIPTFTAKIQNDKSFINKEDNLQIVLTADEINESLPETLKSYNIQLENPTVEINSTGLILSCNLRAGIKIPVSATLLPVVNVGKINFEIVKSKMGFVPMPGLLKAGIEESLNNLMDSNLKDFYSSYTATMVQTLQNQMTIYGNLKK